MSSPMDVDTRVQIALQSLSGDPPMIITTLPTISNLRAQREKAVIAAVRSRGNRTRPGDMHEVAVFLLILHEVDNVFPQMKTELHLDQALQLIVNPDFNFTEDYVCVAQYILDGFDQDNWGEGENTTATEVEIDDEASSSQAASSQIVNSSASPSQAASSSSSRPASSSQTAPASNYYPHPNDPVYGTNGIMHDILRISGQGPARYKLDQRYIKPSAHYFGHGNLSIGDCWPLQMALIRDGAHGARMGGISGNPTDGAYSIVISGGMYDGLDQDNGHRFSYAASGAQDNKKPEPVDNTGSKALERSLATGRPVRVFRSSRGHWRHVPRAGIRYDGLYTVVSVATRTNRSNGAYKLFSLERNDGQPPINLNAPSARQVNQFESIGQGYTMSR